MTEGKIRVSSLSGGRAHFLCVCWGDEGAVLQTTKMSYQTGGLIRSENQYCQQQRRVRQVCLLSALAMTDQRCNWGYNGEYYLHYDIRHTGWPYGHYGLKMLIFLSVPTYLWHILGENS